MAPKRRRADSSPKETKASNKRASPKPCCMEIILEEVKNLAKDKQRCSDALLDFVSGKCTLEESDPKKHKAADNPDCYWIILVTHVIHRLTESGEFPEVLALLCHYTSIILLHDRAKLERCANAAMASSQNYRLARSVVGRAIVAITIGSTVALEKLVQESSSETNEAVLWACLVALERVIHLSHSPKSHTGDDTWGAAQERLLYTLNAFDVSVLKDECRNLNDSLNMEGAEQACITALQTPAKKSSSRRSRTNKDESPIVKNFQTLLEEFPSNSIVMDGRVSIRRWASMAFVWLCQGQESVLKVALELLQVESWSEALQCEPIAENETTVTGNVAVVALVCRLLDVLSESGNACGVRAPTGGMDAYAKSMVDPPPQKRKSAKKGGHTWIRPDVRNLAAVACYQLIQAHKECLESNTHLNLLGDEEKAVVSNEARYYPFVNKTLDSLCRAAASSVVNSASVDASDSVQRLLGIASAFCLESVDDKLDVKLCTFAVNQLLECLRNILSDDENSGRMEIEGDSMDKIQEEFLLGVPLPVPTIAEPKSRRKKKDESDACTFGQVFVPPPPENQIITDEQLLALHLRVYHESPAEALISKLLHIVECCYDVPQDKMMESLTTSSPTKAGSKKRAAKKKATGGRGKRRKVGKGKEEISEVVANEEHVEDTPKITPISSTRSGLASDVLNALRMCLVHSPSGYNEANQRCTLRRSLRRSLTTDQVCTVVKLGQELDRVLIKARLTTRRPFDSDSETPSFFAARRSEDFSHVERCNWTSHVNICETLGRGQTMYDPRKLSLVKEPILGDTTRRLEVFRCVASYQCEKRKIDKWPLFLPPVQHALVTSNLTSERLPTNRSEAAPELFIVDSLLNSISETLSDLNTLASEKTTGEYTPLSLRDARLLVLAVCRLPSADQEESLKKLINVVASSLETLSSIDSQRALIVSNKCISGFIARLVTVVATLVNTVYVAPSLREALFLQVGPTHYQLPVLQIDEDNDYSQSKSFMGIFADWESPTIPEVSLPGSPPRVKEEITKKLDKITERSMFLGFSSANNDNGHLLFAAWNASGKAIAWDKKKGEYGTSSLDKSSFHVILAELREDICVAQRAMHGDSFLFPDSLLSAVLMRRNQHKTPSKIVIRTGLKTMLSKAERLVETCCSKFLASAGGQLSPLPVAAFSLFEAISVYLSYIVSAYSRAGTDYLSSGTRRPKTKKQKVASSSDEMISREIISDDDSDGSQGFEDEYDEDARIEALSRLHDTCSILGAAPTHPDWLEKSCRLREPFSAADALDAAERVLKCLYRLASCAYTLQIEACNRALESFALDEADQSERAMLALLLSRTICDQEGTNNDQFSKLSDHISSLCRIDKRALKLFSVAGEASQSRPDMGWIETASQRILGNLQEDRLGIEGWTPSSCELRATGEWELFLTNVLVRATMKVDLDQAQSTEEVSESDKEDSSADQVSAEQAGRGLACILEAHRWQCVVETAISSVAPASALLRFALEGGEGRRRHPLNKRDPSSGIYAHQFRELHVVEELSSSLQGSKETSALVHQILSLIGLVSSEAMPHSPWNSVSQCQFAASSNLLIDSNSIHELAGMDALRTAFMCMIAVQAKTRDDPSSNPQEASRNALLQNLVQNIVLNSRESHLNTFLETASNPRGDSSGLREGGTARRLLAFLGNPSMVDVRTIVGACNAGSVTSDLGTLHSSIRAEVQKLGSIESPERDVSELVGLLFQVVDGDSKYYLTDILSGVAELEFELNGQVSPAGSTHLPVIKSILTALAKTDGKDFKSFLESDVCLMSVPAGDASAEERGRISDMLCAMLSTILCCAEENSALQELVYATLSGSMESWCMSKMPSVSEQVLDLLVLYGIRLNVLSEIATKLLSMDDLRLVERFFRLIAEIQNYWGVDEDGSSDSRRARNASETLVSFSLGDRKKFGNKDGDRGQLLCSYANHKSFHDQHWYNCYTCGLLDDRGCCSVCARVCHTGHKVSYSRFSSFFCDCGAESNTNDITCKCLNPMKSPPATDLYDQDMSSSNYYDVQSRTVIKESGAKTAEQSTSETAIDRRRWIKIASSALKTAAPPAFANLRKTASEGCWLEALFAIINLKFELWNGTRQTRLETGVAGPLTGDMNEPFLTKYASLRNSLAESFHIRAGKELSLDLVTSKGMLPVRAAKAGSFKVKVSSDPTDDRLKRALLDKFDIKRAALVADSRGRLIIAEPSRLLFCSAFPMVNTRFIERANEQPLERRSHLAVLGTSAILNFSVVGMALCKDDERLLLVWGTSEASVIYLSPFYDRVEKSVELTLGLDAHECDSELILKCSWITGSDTIVVVACSMFLKVFSLRRQEDRTRVTSSLCFNVGHESSLRDFAVVPVRSGNENRLNDDNFGKVVKLFLMLDSGHLRVLDIKTDQHGELVDRGEKYSESSEGLALPTAGACLYQGASPAASDSMSRSIGEGLTSGLSYLAQSGLLLYSCASSCVLAIILDADGDISGSFEFLPQVITSNVLGKGSRCSDISGPFSQWTELGVIADGESLFFRTACVGLHSKSNQPRIVTVDYNSRETRVRDLPWVGGNSMCLDLSLSRSCEGMAAFSAPVNIGDRSSGCWQERSFLVSLTSNGAMLFFGEASNPPLALSQANENDLSLRLIDRANSEVCPATNASADEVPSGGKQDGVRGTNPKFPLTVFESLTNASEFEELSFGCEGVGSPSETIKTKLSVKNNVFYMTPGREGCTITISIRTRDRETTGAAVDSNETANSKSRDEIAIVALRVLVGSTTTDFVPKRVFVEGRPVELNSAMKRWYDIPLTYEEVALGVRNGFVTLGIDQSFDGCNNPVVDAVEVYVTERKILNRWLPKLLYASKTSATGADHKDISLAAGDGTSSQELLVLSILSATQLCHVLGGVKGDFGGSRKTLQRLIRSTALYLHKRNETRDCSVELLKAVEDNDHVRTAFLDENSLYGLMEALIAAGSALKRNDEMEVSVFADESAEESVVSSTAWNSLSEIIDDCCLVGARIAKSNPRAYLAATKNIISEGLTSNTILLEVWKLFEQGMNGSRDSKRNVASIVKLVLTEMAFCSDTDGADRHLPSQVEVLRKLLESSDVQTVSIACAAVSEFVLIAESGSSPDSEEATAEQYAGSKNDQSTPIAYQCDSCVKFPITGERYTLLEDDHDIDLCKECFRLGNEYSELLGFAPDKDVTIRGKRLSLGESSYLSCAQIKQMRPVPIPDNVLEQVEQSGRAVNPAVEGSDGSLLDAFRRSEPRSENIPESRPTIASCEGHQSWHDRLSKKLIDEIITPLLSPDKIETIPHPIPLIRLVLTVVFSAGHDSMELERAKQLATNLTHRAAQLLHLWQNEGCDDTARQNRIKGLLTLCLRSLSCLLQKKKDPFGEPPNVAKVPENPFLDPVSTLTPRSKDKTDPNFVCDVHGVRAVRRRCSRGRNKNRRFYVCGLERKLRCKYFRWADADENVDNDPASKNSKHRLEMERFLWNLFSKRESHESEPLHAQLYEVLNADYQSYEALRGVQQSPSACLQATGTSGGSTLDVSGRAAALESSCRDFDDGVICSKEKLGWSRDQLETSPSGEEVAFFDGVKGEVHSVEASLELMALIAEDSLESGCVASESTMNWFSLLCEIISSSSSSNFRSLAKRALKRLCGHRREVYHSVRDHLMFGLLFEKIFKLSQTAMEEAMLRKEQARQCGSNWRSSESVTWKNLRAGGLIGIQDLMSESCLSVDASTKIASLLDELNDATAGRSSNWRQFCGLSSIARSHLKHKLPIVSEKDSTLKDDGPFEAMRVREYPPILALLWVACSLPGVHQTKAFCLIDKALTLSDDSDTKLSITNDEEHLEELGEVFSSDGGFDTSSKGTPSNAFLFGENDLMPEEALIRSENGLGVDELHALIIQFVLRAKTAELRKVSSRVCLKLSEELTEDDASTLFLRLVGSPLAEVGELGRESIEFFTFLIGLARRPLSSEAVESVAEKLVACFCAQMKILLQHPDSNVDDSILLKAAEGGNDEKKRFDLSCCVHCHRQLFLAPSTETERKGSSERKPSQRSARFFDSTNDPSRTSLAPQGKDSQWLPDQVKPFSRGRLEASTDSTASTEFANFIRLKFRLAVSNFYLTVNDPRGRFVKTIAIYYTPRQVNDVKLLKTDDYAPLWQRCATLSLSRGASRASCALAQPVVAANLKIEYLDFYDKPTGATRSSDGSLLLLCPRCTRIVNNAHGVCGNCGEVAFQCRKCRHINYDRLDAFLCVECGYCSSGGFSYELTSGIASNAVSISDEADFSRAVKTLRVATKLHQDMRASLREKVTSSKSGKPSSRSSFDVVDALSGHSSSLKRALLGQLPSHSGKRDGRSGRKVEGSAVASIASSKANDSGNRLSAANRARSLIRLARQLRSDSGGSSDRSRTGDLFMRQAAFFSAGSRGMLVEDIEESGDLLGIINSGDGLDVLPMDSGDSLSRLVASIQSRSRESGGRDGGDDDGADPDNNGGGSGGRSGGTADESSPATLLKECERIHKLMREAERECFEIKRRIDAWNRLETDSLAELGTTSTPGIPFNPTKCSVCACPVTLKLLHLVKELLRGRLDTLDGVITKEFVRALFAEPVGLDSELFEQKRQLIYLLATKSDSATRLVLNELQARLRATRDVASAQILGKLVAKEFDMVQEYVNLAMEIAAECA